MKQNYDFKIKNKRSFQRGNRFKKKNLELFYQTGFPNKKDEDWKFSDLNSIIKKNL